MAIIDIKNARVTKHVGANGAFQIAETYNGDWVRYWTVWSDATPAPDIDTFVSVAGEYNSKIREYEAKNGDTKQAVERSINNPIITSDADALIAGLVEVADADAPF